MLLGISKRGDRYLHTLLIHGARSVTRRAKRKRDARSVSVNRLKLRSGPNVTAVGLANKNARVMWALLARDQSYRPPRRRAVKASRAKRAGSRRALTATGVTAQQVVKQLLDATASLIHHCRNREITDSATHQKIAQIVLAMWIAKQSDRRLPNLLLPWASRARSHG